MSEKEKGSDFPDEELGSLPDGDDDEGEEELTAPEFVMSVLSSWDEQGVPVVVSFEEDSLRAIRSLEDSIRKLTKAISEKK
jgi:hypothetical protein